jgi:type II secretory pathway pseudopilin PulG
MNTNVQPVQSIKSTRAFSLIQLIGVLAIIAIIVSLMVPNVIREMDQAMYTREYADLAEFQKALTNAIVKNRVISNYDGIPNQIAGELATPLAKITSTPYNRPRAFLVDPSLSLMRGSGVSNLPYAQTTNGGVVSRPLNARMLIVSVLNGTVPLSSGVPSSTVFNAIWNTALNSVPTLPSSGWPTSGREVCIQRINLEPLFNQLILINHDATNNPGFSIDSMSTGNITGVTTNGYGWNNYYLNSSVVGLWQGSSLLNRYILNRNISYVFEYGAWRGSISAGPNNTNASAFMTAAEAFYESPANPDAGDANGKGSSQIGVLACMYSYMFNYTLWATETPAFSDHQVGGAVDAVPEYQMIMGAGALADILDDASNATKGILQN